MSGRIDARPPDAFTGPAPLRVLQHPVPAPTGEYRWVYLWQLPLRIMHWVAAVAIVVLILTGFYIGRPYFMPPMDSGAPYWVGFVRLVHFLAGAALAMTAIVRVYWLFAGNRFERFPALFPVRPRDWVNMFRQVKFYMLIHPERAPKYIGHNPMQQLSYTAMYLVTALMVLTGFALFAPANPGGWIDTAFGWLIPLFGGLQTVRLLHHVVTWVFVAFIPIHIYLAMRADVWEHSGSVSSIISGGKFVDVEEEFEDD